MYKKKFPILKLIFFAVIALLIYSLFITDKFLLESAIIESKFIINNQINLAIHNAVSNLTKKNHLTTDNFCNINVEDGKIVSLSANTILINEFCSNLAVSIPTEFINLGANYIKIPFGTIISSFCGINFFNFMGPIITIKMLPVGNALIDYESKFIGAGINQTNFQIWLDVKFYCQVINPLIRKQITFKKKIPLVNTIINGNVPTVMGSKNFFN